MGSLTLLTMRFWKQSNNIPNKGCELPARYRVIKPVRVVVSRNSRVCRVTKSFLWRPCPRRKAPAGALCGVLASRNIVCRLCAGTRHRGGRKSGRCGAYVPLSCITCAMPPHRENQPIRRAAYSRGFWTFQKFVCACRCGDICRIQK